MRSRSEEGRCADAPFHIEREKKNRCHSLYFDAFPSSDGNSKRSLGFDSINKGEMSFAGLVRLSRFRASIRVAV